MNKNANNYQTIRLEMKNLKALKKRAQLAVLFLTACILIIVYANIQSNQHYSYLHNQWLNEFTTIETKKTLLTGIQKRLGTHGFLEHFGNLSHQQDIALVEQASANISEAERLIIEYKQLAPDTKELYALEMIDPIISHYRETVNAAARALKSGRTAVNITDNADHLLLEEALDRLTNSITTNSTKIHTEMQTRLHKIEDLKNITLYTLSVFSLSAFILIYFLFHFANRLYRQFKGSYSEGVKSSAIIEQSLDGIITINDQGIIETFNAAATRIFSYSAKEAIGQNVAILLPKDERAHHDDYVKRSQLFSSRVINKTRDLYGRRRDGSQFPMELSVTRQHDNGFVGIFRDISERKADEAKIRFSNQTLDAISAIQGSFIAAENRHQVFDAILKRLIELTRSEYGFIGEVLYDENDKPYLKIFALTNITGDKKTRKLYDAQASDGLELKNLKTLFGRTLTTGKTVISNSPNKVPQPSGLPHAPPELNAYLGMPLKIDDKLIGMFGLANREGGYDEALAIKLQAVATACAQIIQSVHNQNSRAIAQQQAETAKQEAEKANLAKSEFLSSMSHELRTPLNAILGFSQLLQLDIKSPLSTDQKENVDEILQAGRHLLSLINEILNLARIESGNVEISMEDVDIHPLMDQCLLLTSPIAKQQQININVEGDIESQLMIRADYTRLKQVIINLLSNAIKYNRKGGSIHITHQIIDDYLRINITDTGHGLSAKQLKRLFIPFERLGQEMSNIEGTGIGLMLCKNLIKGMNGRIGVESTVGKGSTFWIELETSKPDNETSITTRALNSDSDQNDTIEKDNISSHNTDDTSKPIHILYIEDNPANRKLIEKLCQGFKQLSLKTAERAETGINMAKNDPPDIILMDISLPGMNGYEALTIIHSYEHLRHIPIVALSANAMQADIDKGLAAGFNDYLAKPINTKQLLDTINDLGRHK